MMSVPSVQSCSSLVCFFPLGPGTGSLSLPTSCFSPSDVFSGRSGTSDICHYKHARNEGAGQFGSQSQTSDLEVIKTGAVLW